MFILHFSNYLCSEVIFCFLDFVAQGRHKVFRQGKKLNQNIHAIENDCAEFQNVKRNSVISKSQFAKKYL